jgi:hypothetical protein
MTENKLTGLAHQTLNMAKTDMELRGFTILIACYHSGEGLHRMRKLEMELGERLGEGWLDSDERKDAGFDWLRIALNVAGPPDAIITVTRTNMFKSTEKLAALSDDETRKVEARSQRSAERLRMVDEGLFTLINSLTAVAQTPENVCICSQEVRRGAFVGQPTTIQCSQAEYGGRGQMYSLSKEEEEILAQARAELLTKMAM